MPAYNKNKETQEKHRIICIESPPLNLYHLMRDTPRNSRRRQGTTKYPIIQPNTSVHLDDPGR